MALNYPNTEPQFVGYSATCNDTRAIWSHQLATTQWGSIAYYIHDEFVLRARARERALRCFAAAANSSSSSNSSSQCSRRRASLSLFRSLSSLSIETTVSTTPTSSGTSRTSRTSSSGKFDTPLTREYALLHKALSGVLTTAPSAIPCTRRDSPNTRRDAVDSRVQPPSIVYMLTNGGSDKTAPQLANTAAVVEPTTSQQVFLLPAASCFYSSNHYPPRSR